MQIIRELIVQLLLTSKMDKLTCNRERGRDDIKMTILIINLLLITSILTIVQMNKHFCSIKT